MKVILDGVNPVRIVIIILVVITSGACFYAWAKPQDVRIQKEYVQVAVPEYIDRIKRVEIPVEKIIVIEKKVIVREMPDLPEEIKISDEKQIATVGEIDCPEKSTVSMAAVVDTSTGGIIIVAKNKPKVRPFFELMNQGEAGMRYGASTESRQEVSTFARWTFARVSSVHFAFYAETNSKPEAKVMLEAGFRWGR